jgi:hypothetical protein
MPVDGALAALLSPIRHSRRRRGGAIPQTCKERRISLPVIDSAGLFIGFPASRITYSAQPIRNGLRVGGSHSSVLFAFGRDRREFNKCADG